MARYIDADALIEEIKSLEVIVTGLRAGKGVIREYAKNYKESVLKTIDEQPIAYDVDAVVEQLEENNNVCADVLNELFEQNPYLRLAKKEYCKGRLHAYKKAIDIVRNAGKDGGE